MTFSVSNFTAERRRWLSGTLDKWAFVEVLAAIFLSLLSPFAGAWLGISGLLFVGLSGGVRISDRLLRPKAKTERRIFRPCNTGLRFNVLRHVCCVRAHSRAYRSAPRPSFACASGSDDSEGGGSESDSGDPPWPGFSFSVASFQNFAQKLNSFLHPWRPSDAPGCWSLLCRQPSVKGARS
jgi:hypothetical protein